MLNNAILCSFTTLFVYTAFQIGSIFEKAGIWLEVKLGVLYNPVIGCLYCMAPWWGFIYCLTFLDYSIKEGLQFLFTVGGINVLLAGIINHLRNE